MSLPEFLAWCAGGAVFGVAVGVVMARPEEAVRGLVDALTQVGRMVVDGAYGLWRWRP